VFRLFLHRRHKKVEELRKIVNEERKISISEIAGRFGLSHGTCQRALRN
jgi:ribosomal protein S25